MDKNWTYRWFLINYKKLKSFFIISFVILCLSRNDLIDPAMFYGNNYRISIRICVLRKDRNAQFRRAWQIFISPLSISKAWSKKDVLKMF